MEFANVDLGINLLYMDLHGVSNVINETLPVISGVITTINRFITPLADLQGHL